MKIAFYHDHHADRHIYERAFACAREVYPAAHLIHLCAAGGIETLPDVTRLEVILKGTFAEQRCFAHLLTHLRWPGEDILFLDTDCFLLAPVDEVWEEPFDLCVTLMERPLHHMMPTNSGVVFSRSPEFWALLFQRNQGLPFNVNDHSWVQLETNFNNLLSKPRFRVSYVAGSLYNHIPEDPAEVAADAKIVHWKGPRKAWVPKA